MKNTVKMVYSELYTKIDPKILHILKQEKIIKLYPPQEEALSHSLLGKNLVLAMPTASGKTLVAEITIVQGLLDLKRKNIKKKILYLCPLKALASEKYLELKKRWESLGIKIGYSIGDLDRINFNVFNNDIIIMTNEKADSILRNKPNLIKDLDWIIIDEIHLINDETRGVTLEIIITRIMNENPDAKIIGLSATIKNANELSNWLNAELIKNDWRPISLKEGILSENTVLFSNGDLRNLKNKTLDPIFNLVSDMLDENGQCLIFTSTRKNSQTQAEKLAAQLRFRYNPEDLRKFEKVSIEFSKLLNQNETSTGITKLADTLKSGVAFHNAGLTQSQRQFIEDNFRKGSIKVLTATPTLAAGVNTPARMVIIKSLFRYDGILGRSNRIPILEYKQMVGRAGRPGFDPYGESIIITKNSDKLEELIDYYISGEPEPIISKLKNPNLLQTHILGFIAMRGESNKNELIDFLSKTFLSFQIKSGTNFDSNLITKKKIFSNKNETSVIQKNKKLMDGRRNRKGARGNDPLFVFSGADQFISASELHENRKTIGELNKIKYKESMTNEDLKQFLNNIVQDTINFLVENEFIIQCEHSKPKMKLKYTATDFGAIVCNMYLNPESAAIIFRKLKDLDSILKESGTSPRINEITILYIIALSQELLGGYFRKSEYNLIKAQVLKYKKNLEIFSNENDKNSNFRLFDDMNALKQTFILADWIGEVPESRISDTFGVGLGDLHRYIETARWLARAIYQFSKLLKNDKLIRLSEKLSSRIKYGVKKELIKFVNFRGIGRVRARILYKNGIMSVKQIMETPDKELESLSNLISHNLVTSIKSQINSGKIKEYNMKTKTPNKDIEEIHDEMIDQDIENSILKQKLKLTKSKMKQSYII